MTNTKTAAKALIAIAAVVAATFAGAASAATPIDEQWGGDEPVAQGPALSRAEVQADLNLWNRAGLGQVNAGDRTPDADPTYQARVAEYQRLRSGPEFVAEVRRLGGEVSRVAGQAGASTAH
jgi:hypothetical protein